VRVALDTSVLVSAVATRGRCADLFNLVLAEHELIVGETVLTEKIRDKTGLPVLPEAAAGNAEVLVTGDRGLLEATEELPLKILAPRGLWDRLRQDVPPPQ
jgi:predicted nucleic acid-binding protein